MKGFRDAVQFAVARDTTVAHVLEEMVLRGATFARLADTTLQTVLSRKKIRKDVESVAISATKLTIVPVAFIGSR